MKTLNKLHLFLCAVTFIRSSAQNHDHLSVPKPVLDHILNYNNQYKYEPEERTVPVYNVEIGADDQINSQQIQMLGLRNIDESLRTVFRSGEMADHIVSQVEQRSSAKPSFRQQENCPPTTNIISVDVPPNELLIFHERMERVTQQNNNILMGLINGILSAKLADIEKKLMAFTDARIDMVHQQIEDKFRDLRIVAHQSLYPDAVKNKTTTMGALVKDTHKTEYSSERVVAAQDKDIASGNKGTESESQEIETPSSILSSIMRDSVRIH